MLLVSKKIKQFGPAIFEKSHFLVKEISKEAGKELYKKGQFSQDGQEFLAANNFTDPYECCWYATKIKKFGPGTF